MRLSPTVEKYILHWGEMGTRWGVNRTVAQIHALLYLSPKPLCADEIVELLSVARSNVSVSLHELQSYNLVKVTHILGDRRDHFEALHDIWDMFMVIVEQRRQREIDPTLTLLRQCVVEAEDDKQIDPITKQRIGSMLDFLERLTKWYSEIRSIPRPILSKLMRLGSRITQWVPKR